jgi:hypothetical protein
VSEAVTTVPLRIRRSKSKMEASIGDGMSDLGWRDWWKVGLKVEVWGRWESRGILTRNSCVSFLRTVLYEFWLHIVVIRVTGMSVD